MSREISPNIDEFELSVLGPGRGECIILHLGNNAWCVVDSCRDIGKSESAAVEYLGALGTEALHGVKMVIATHWHDDHIRGIASALRAFPNAQFSCSIAMIAPQFVKLVELTTNSLQRNSGLDEFGAIYDLLLQRNTQSSSKNLVAPAFAIQNRELLKIEDKTLGTTARILALSPSDGTYKESLKYIASLIPQEGAAQQRIINTTPNNTSVVLWISVGSQNALLGADLEHSARIEEGWLAVLGAFDSGNPKAKHFKVPHHGSSNADCEGIWNQLLSTDPIAIVTPFTPSGLPRQDDLERLQKRTSNLYCTAIPSKKPPRRDPLVEKLIKNVERYVVDGHIGHVRIRSSIVDSQKPPTVELFNGAFKVTG